MRNILFSRLELSFDIRPLLRPPRIIKPVGRPTAATTSQGIGSTDFVILTPLRGDFHLATALTNIPSYLSPTGALLRELVGLRTPQPLRHPRAHRDPH